jgi:cytochrome c-type biogenesis protein CcmH/NrfG
MTRYAKLRERAAGLRKQALYARLGITPEADDKEIKAAHEELVGFLKSAPDGVRNWAQSEVAAADEAYALITASAAETTFRPSPLFKWAATVLAIAATVGIGIVVYHMGGGSGAGSQQGGTAQAKSLPSADEAKVAVLMKKLKTSPTDVTSLRKLGDIYFQAGDFKTAKIWLQQIVAADPKNVTGHVALGAALFNLGGTADAQREWLKAVELDPKNVEAYYDLGFLYLGKQPPDTAAAKAAWGKVVKLAPKSAVAKTIATHLKSLNNPATAPSTASGK